MSENNPGKSAGSKPAGGEPPKTWHRPDGSVIACVEKIRLLNENFNELQQLAQDAFDDGLLLFGQPFQDMADLFQQQLAARRLCRVLFLVAERILQGHASFIGFVEGYGADGTFAFQIIEDGPADTMDGK